MKLITAYSPALKAGLKDYIRSRAASSGRPDWGADFARRLEHFATGGKLLRGCVLCFAYEAFSGREPDGAVMDAAMALELTHSAILIHDDIMDGDDMRRGRPSMHRQYRQAARREGLSEPGRLGINLALAGGDSALFMAFDLLGRGGASGADRRPHDLFIDQLLKTCSGQMQDVYLEARPAMPAKREIYALMRTKTAAYTLALPLTMGAAMAGRPSSVIRQLKSVGIAGGTIFQIRDDELGVLGDPDKTGKPVGADIKEDKKTLFRYYLHKTAGRDERRRLEGIFGNPSAAPDDIAYVQKLARRHDIPRLLAQEIRALRKQASDHIAGLPADATSKKELNNLIDFCARRQY
jgi:geranylgeranyl pyrophosphate synthase